MMPPPITTQSADFGSLVVTGTITSPDLSQCKIGFPSLDYYCRMLILKRIVIGLVAVAMIAFMLMRLFRYGR
jgi:hypothetical protein